MFPPTSVERRQPQAGVYLRAANSTPIATYGKRSLTLNLGLRRSYQWIFILADVKYPILGADFLQAHKLLVDVHSRRLIDSLTHLNVNIITTHTNSPSPSHTCSGTPQEVAALLAQFPELTIVMTALNMTSFITSRLLDLQFTLALDVSLQSI